jgi:hypothetical protein
VTSLAKVMHHLRLSSGIVTDCFELMLMHIHEVSIPWQELAPAHNEMWRILRSGSETYRVMNDI